MICVISDACVISDPLCVCSAAGISRSVTMTVMYIMTVSSLGFQDALRVVKHCREPANPNFGFRTQLQRYQEEKLPDVSAHSAWLTQHTELNLEYFQSS